jgi:hypothetical protein
MHACVCVIDWLFGRTETVTAWDSSRIRCFVTCQISFYAHMHVCMISMRVEASYSYIQCILRLMSTSMSVVTRLMRWFGAYTPSIMRDMSRGMSCMQVLMCLCIKVRARACAFLCSFERQRPSQVVEIWASNRTLTLKEHKPQPKNKTRNKQTNKQTNKRCKNKRSIKQTL